MLSKKSCANKIHQRGTEVVAGGVKWVQVAGVKVGVFYLCDICSITKKIGVEERRS